MVGNDTAPRMKPSTPPWLLRSFVEAVRNIHACASTELAQRIGEELLKQWNAPTRSFHNAHHLANMLSRIDELSATTHDPDTLRVAAWFWGALGTQAAEFSAEQSDKKINHCHRFVMEKLGELGFDDEKKKRVCELIAHLFEHHAPSDDLDATALVDASLAVFASMPQEYKRYRQAVREEYPHFTDLQYQVRRRRYIRALLKRSTIYRSPFASQWESIARQNLEAELVNLDASIAKLDPSIGDDSAFDRPDPHANEPVSRTFVVKRSENKHTELPEESPVPDRSVPPDTSTPQRENTARGESSDDRADTTEHMSDVESRSPAPSAGSEDSTMDSPSDVAGTQSAPSAVSPHEASAPVPRSEHESSPGDGGSSLEAEPDFLDPIKAAPPRRLSAKEHARETRMLRKSETSSSEHNDEQDSGEVHTENSAHRAEE